MQNFENENVQTTPLGNLLDSLCKNEIAISTKEATNCGNAIRSKFGGKPAVPSEFVWPRFSGKNFDEEVVDAPLSFFCQINLEEIHAFDTDNKLPDSGLLLFFYEQETMRWGFDPADAGCSRVFYFEDVSALESADYPEDLDEKYRVKEYDLLFDSRNSYPDFEELERHTGEYCDFDEYWNTVTEKGYDIENESHKILGYANLVQGEFLTECERTARGLYCGNPKSYRSTPEDEKEDIKRCAKDWTLLFQMDSIQDKDFELMFGDMGAIYFNIREQDLKERKFDKVWLVLQCG